MSYKTVAAAVCVMLAVVSLTSTGCLLPNGPNLGLLAVPIPVSPYHQKLLEDKFHIQERYNRVPIMGPLTSGGPARAMDPPSDDEVMRAFERARPVQGGIPFLHERRLDNVRIVKEKIADYVDPPRFVPLIGPAQLHHAHYKCTIYFSETTTVTWPFPHELKDNDSVEVIYIDHNHFHQVGNLDGGPSSNY